jgi:hypothetical protein
VQLLFRQSHSFRVVLEQPHRYDVVRIIPLTILPLLASLDESVFIQHFPALPNISTSGSDSGFGPGPESGSGSAGGHRRIPPIVHRTGVRCLLPLHLTSLGEDAPYLLTGSGDFIRTFDLGSIADTEQTQGPSEAAQLVGTVDGHWHDVTALRLWLREVPVGTVSRSTAASTSMSSPGEEGRTRLEPWVVSASLDGTIRKWRLLGEYHFSLGSDLPFPNGSPH